MFLASFFKKVGRGVGSLFGLLNSDKAKKIYNNIGELADKTLPAIELVVKLTPTTTDDMVLAGLRKLGLTISEILDKTNKRLHDNNRLDLAIEIFIQQLIASLAKGEKIKFGDLVLQTTEDILALDRSLIKSAVQDGYTLWKLAKK